MKHEEFDITTSTPIGPLANLGAKLSNLLRAVDKDYKATNVVIPTVLVNDDFLSGA